MPQNLWDFWASICCLFVTDSFYTVGLVRLFNDKVMGGNPNCARWISCSEATKRRWARHCGLHGGRRGRTRSRRRVAQQDDAEAEDSGSLRLGPEQSGLLETLAHHGFSVGFHDPASMNQPWRQ